MTPADTLRDARAVLRTGAVVVSTLGMLTLRGARNRGRETPSSNTAAGLEVISETAAKVVRALGIELEVFGIERVPKSGGVVFLWNQVSHLEHLVIPSAMPRPFFSLYNNEIARFPYYGRYMRKSGHCHVDRNDEAQWRPVIAEAARRVREGECLLASPEGTRSPDGRLLPMKRGVFMLIREAQCPIVCVTLIGGYERMPRGAWFVRPGPMRIVFGKPIPVEPDRSDGLEDRVRDEFTRTKTEYRFGST